jgi:hypothetical protein
MDENVHDHDEANSLRKARTRLRDTLRLILPELKDPGTKRFLDVGGGQIAWLVAPPLPRPHARRRPERRDRGGV